MENFFISNNGRKVSCKEISKLKIKNIKEIEIDLINIKNGVLKFSFNIKTQTENFYKCIYVHHSSLATKHKRSVFLKIIKNLIKYMEEKNEDKI
jgi:hypothetical protein